MNIKQMTATFGTLHQSTLAPSEGLTVISAPNESGKSTWAGFLKAMLYGIDTRERDKNGIPADKNRYQPWSGAPMWGELRLDWEGKDITLRRTSNRSGPMQGFEAVYTASGDPVTELTAANAGQTLLGVGREVFVRSALVGQNGVAVTNNAELESRIAALATSGQEDTSYSAAERTLKDWKNRRRLNRSKGLIPELEQELAGVESALDQLKQARLRKAEAEGRLQELGQERQELSSELDIHRRLAQKELNRRYGQALEGLNRVQQELGELPMAHPVYEGLTSREAREKAADLTRKAAQYEEALRLRQAQEEELLRLQQQAKRLRARRISAVLPLGIAAIALIIPGLLLPLLALSVAGILCAAAAVCLAVVFTSRLKQFSLPRPDPAPLPPPPESIPDVEEYLSLLNRKELLEQEARHCLQRAEDLKAQGAREFDTLELLHTPTRSAAELSAQLSAAERESTLWQTRLDQAIGALQADPLELEARRDALLDEIQVRTRQFDALDIALKSLERANTVLRERFSPALNREASRIFSQLTGGKYTALSLSRDFSAMAGEASSPQPHSAAYLSAGTADQLYLAVRLAICSLTLPGVPLLLDDALAAFDDSRAELALQCLKELARDRQILLFSCHGREARWAEENHVPVIRL